MDEKEKYDELKKLKNCQKRKLLMIFLIKWKKLEQLGKIIYNKPRIKRSEERRVGKECL